MKIDRPVITLHKPDPLTYKTHSTCLNFKNNELQNCNCNSERPHNHENIEEKYQVEDSNIL